MDDSHCRRFFLDASSTTYHRQYEALRAVSAALHALADAMSSPRPPTAGPDKGFQTIVIN